MTRRRLANRRAHESRDLTFRGQQFAIGIGRDLAGRPAEIFVDARKTGSEYASLARDAGILLSLALQHGADLEVIRHALTHEHDGGPGSLLGAVVNELGEAR